MAKKKKPTKYISIMQNGQITLSVNKIITSVAISLVIGAIAGGFTVVSLANSNAIRITAAEYTISDIKESMVSQKEWEQSVARMDRIETKIDRLLER